MKYIAISGSWRNTNQEITNDVESTVIEIINSGNGIVTGGALGVDYIATAKALELDKTAENLLVILPTSLEIYFDHFRNRANEGVITHELAESLIQQLETLKEINPVAIEEMDADVCNPETYYARNTRVIDTGDELYAFHVNNSKGVQDAIDKATNDNKVVTIQSYTIG